MDSSGRCRNRTGVIKDPDHGGHCMGFDEPECPERLDALFSLLEEPGLSECLIDITPRMVETEDLERVHDREYIERLAATAGKSLTFLDPDTRASHRSHEVALLAAGGLCKAIEQVHNGEVDNAFALIRPPGHHAERASSGGFCLYNNIAIGARYAQNTLGLQRILIVDWDLHHGNGTQHCFEEDPSVLFFSTHRAFTYPHTGHLKETGKGSGRGYTVNIPLPTGIGDGEYLALYDKALKPIALSFKPDIILVSAGFDIHFDDPLGDMRVTPKGFAAMTRILMDLADTCCKGRLVMALEGGYDLEGLKSSVREVLMEMAGLQVSDIDGIISSTNPQRIEYLLWRLNRIHRKQWENLGEIKPPRFLDRFKGTLSRWKDYLNS